MRINSHATTIYETFKPASRLAEVPILLGFNLVLVLCAYITINLPFSPVPITGQTFGVLLIAMALGRTRATAVVLAYLIEGACGLPVFAGGATGPAVFIGPTGGYLVSFLAAAYLVGMLADRAWDRSYLKSLAAMTIGTALIFVGGLAQLSLFLPTATLLTAGLYPFIPGALVKIGLAALLLPSVRKMLG